ncbi:MAG: hypothetical protein HY040_03435 [Planctomycetes bacterium]|nr:hypothetical protein [Planctomycetota bacterium]
MSPRILLLAGFSIALLAFPDESFARQRRFFPNSIRKVRDTRPTSTGDSPWQAVEDLQEPRQKKEEVTLELRIATTSPEAFRGLHQDMKLKLRREMPTASDDDKRTVRPAGPCESGFVNDKQVWTLLDKLQQCRTTSIMQAPKTTTASGELAVVNVTDQQFFITAVEVKYDGDDVITAPRNVPFTIGLHVSSRSTVSADGGFVHVQLEGFSCSLAAKPKIQPVQLPMKRKNDEGKVETEVFTIYMQNPKFIKVQFTRDMTIPDGGTMLVNLGTYSAEERDDAVSWVTELLFGQPITTTVERQMLLMVTPRIVTRQGADSPVRVHGGVGP